MSLIAIIDRRRKNPASADDSRSNDRRLKLNSIGGHILQLEHTCNRADDTHVKARRKPRSREQFVSH